MSWLAPRPSSGGMWERCSCFHKFLFLMQSIITGFPVGETHFPKRLHLSQKGATCGRGVAKANSSSISVAMEGVSSHHGKTANWSWKHENRTHRLSNGQQTPARSKASSTSKAHSTNSCQGKLPTVKVNKDERGLHSWTTPLGEHQGSNMWSSP